MIPRICGLKKVCLATSANIKRIRVIRFEAKKKEKRIQRNLARLQGQPTRGWGPGSGEGTVQHLRSAQTH
jgi:hypothetical protein